MKRIFLPLIAIAFFSCASDDSDNTEQNIVGNWKIETMLVNDEDITNDCISRTTVRFQDNNKYKAEEFSEGALGCEVVRFEGSWKRISTNVYSIIIADSTKNFQASLPDHNTLKINYSKGPNDAVRVVQTLARQ